MPKWSKRGDSSYPARKAAWAVSINPSKALTVLLPRPRNTQEHRPREPASRGEDPEGGHWTRVLQKGAARPDRKGNWSPALHATPRGQSLPGPAPAPAAASRPTRPSQDALPPEPDPRPGLPAGQGRPRRRFPSRQGRGLAAAVGRPSGGSRGLPSSPSRSTGRGGDKTAARRPAQRPPPAPPHRPPTAAATAATVSQARGAMVAPALVPLPAPSLTPRLGSSPSASCRRHQDTRVRLPHPARSERSSPPQAARGGGTASHRRACQTLAGYLYLAGFCRLRPPPARPTCLGGSPESRPAGSPQLL
ncbi:uncharacterized protein LOC141574974 [Camelus bactrianus]|uniref:Uncharacterized protein LOC141574974 n=1 Tax=Camelus bactrianus TaxID=9837 RepID=A0AC58PFD8_CAMBA